MGVAALEKALRVHLRVWRRESVAAVPAHEEHLRHSLRRSRTGVAQSEARAVKRRHVVDVDFQ